MMSMWHKATSNPFFNKGTRTWKDRTIFDFNKGNVTELNISSPEETIELRLDTNGTWQMLKPEAAAANTTEVDNLLTTLSGLDTDDFADAQSVARQHDDHDHVTTENDLAEYGLDTPQSVISAALNDGTTATLYIGNEAEGKLYVKRDDSNTVFRLFKSNVDRLIKKSDTLKAEAPPARSYNRIANRALAKVSVDESLVKVTQLILVAVTFPAPVTVYLFNRKLKDFFRRKKSYC